MLTFIKNNKILVTIATSVAFVLGGAFFVIKYNPKINTNFENILGEQSIAKGAQWRDGFDAYDHAKKHLSTATEYTITTTGEVKASLNNQLLASKVSFNNGNVHETIYSTGSFKNIAVESYGRVNGNYSVKRTNQFKDGMPVFSNDAKRYSSEKMKEEYGILPTEANYIINEKTIIDTPYFAYKANDNQEMEYIFVLQLHRLTSVRYYRNHMKAISELSKKPRFNEIYLTIHLDNEGRFKTIAVDESYKIIVVAELNATGKLINKYDFDTPVIIEVQS